MEVMAQNKMIMMTVLFLRPLAKTLFMLSYPLNPSRTSASRLGQTRSHSSHPYIAPQKIPSTRIPSSVSGSNGGMNRNPKIIRIITAKCI